MGQTTQPTISADWEILVLEGPDPRYVNQMVAFEDSLVIYGGKHFNNDGYDDCWVLLNNQWRMRNTGPFKVWDHSLTRSGEGLLLFGGRVMEDGERKDINSTWKFKDGVWNRVEVEGPPARSAHAASYNEKSAEIVLFGGRNSQEILDDTWLFRSGKWEVLDINGPSKRYGHGMTYDFSSDNILLFGGFDGKDILDDFWSFDGEIWTQIDVTLSPPPTMAMSMNSDRKGHTVLFGGYTSEGTSAELWVWSGYNWNRIKSKFSPEPRLSGALGYDNASDSFMLFGGSSGFGEGFFSETWQLRIND